MDERADLYALGACAFRALTGRLPFEGTNALTLIALKLDREPPSLAATTGDEWPTGIERFLEKMMARDRDRRFRSADEAVATWRKVCKVMGNSPRIPPRNLVLREQFRSDYPLEDHTEVTASTFSGTEGNLPSGRR